MEPTEACALSDATKKCVHELENDRLPARSGYKATLMGFELAIRTSPAPLAAANPPLVSETESAKRVRTGTIAVTNHSGLTSEFASEPLSFDPVGRNIDLYA